MTTAETAHDRRAPARGGLGALLAPQASIRRRVRRQPFVELAQRNVIRSSTVCFFKSCAGALRIAIGNEQRLANSIERRLERIVCVSPPLLDPAQHLVEIALSPADVLGKEAANAERWGGVMDAFDDGCLLFVAERASRDHFESKDRRGNAVGHIAGNSQELSTEIDVPIQIGRDAEDAVMKRVASGQCPRGARALAVAAALGDNGGGDVPR